MNEEIEFLPPDEAAALLDALQDYQHAVAALLLEFLTPDGYFDGRGPELFARLMALSTDPKLTPGEPPPH